MGTCKDCKHWGKEISQKDKPNLQRECLSFKVGDCPDDDGLKDQYEEFYGIETGPDFGCVHFQSLSSTP